jgi:hypothetical protein
MSSPLTLPSDQVHTSSSCPQCIYAQPVVALPGIVSQPAMKVLYSRRPILSQFTPSCRQPPLSSPVIAITSLHARSRPTVTPRLLTFHPRALTAFAPVCLSSTSITAYRSLACASHGINSIQVLLEENLSPYTPTTLHPPDWSQLCLP